MASPAPPPAPAPSEANSWDQIKANKAVAWIAVVGVLLGGVLGVAASYVATSVQVSSQEQLALDEYRRDQRKDAYTEILSSLSGVEDAEQDLIAQTLFARDVPNAPPVVPNLQPWNDAFVILDQSIAKATIVSSRDVTDISKRLMIIHRRIYNDLVQVSGVSASSPPDAVQAASEAFERAISELEALSRGMGSVIEGSARDVHTEAQELKSSFVAAVKADLDLDD